MEVSAIMRPEMQQGSHVPSLPATLYAGQLDTFLLRISVIKITCSRGVPGLPTPSCRYGANVSASSFFMSRTKGADPPAPESLLLVMPRSPASLFMRLPSTKSAASAAPSSLYFQNSKMHRALMTSTTCPKSAAFRLLTTFFANRQRMTHSEKHPGLGTPTRKRGIWAGHGFSHAVKALILTEAPMRRNRIASQVSSQTRSRNLGQPGG